MLNIDNAFQTKDEIIATSIQPDGSIKGGMLSYGRSWSVTNRIEF